jgi:hypothetical protein
MRRSSSANSKLQQRIRELQREIEQVESGIQGISRAVEIGDPEKAVRRLTRLEAKLGESAAVTATDRPRPAQSAPVAKPEALRRLQSPREALPEEELSIPKAAPGERFANYFASGSLHSVRPLRQERRVQRNKAIVMLILALLVLYGVINMIF